MVQLCLLVLLLFVFYLTNGFSPSGLVGLHAQLDTTTRLAAIPPDTRRRFVTSAVAGVATFSLFPAPSFAGESVATLIDQLVESEKNLEQVPSLLHAGEWDAVRTILKTPPVNYLWNMGDGQNTLLKLSKATDEFELIDLKDEISLSLQMCDQFTYDNVFVYFQPGNGKVKVKEPMDLAIKAMNQLNEAIALAKRASN
jgi:hypothetical protein